MYVRFHQTECYVLLLLDRGCVTELFAIVILGLRLWKKVTIVIRTIYIMMEPNYLFSDPLKRTKIITNGFIHPHIKMLFAISAKIPRRLDDVTTCFVWQSVEVVCNCLVFVNQC